VSLLGRVGAALVAFTGDLIHSPGKVLSMYDMQYNYGATDGVEAAVLSLCLLEERKPDLLCPSHGEPMRDAPGALAATEKNLRAFYRLQSGGKLLADEVDFTPVASRLLHASRTCSSFYVLLSRDGKRALFVDYGAPNFALFQPVTMHFESGERVRFVQHSLRRLREQYGVQKVEAVIPSHYHDDHINGIPYLQRHLGTEVWAYENMKEILENPTAELIGCVLPDPIPVARTFADGERFSWEGLSFDVHFTPGHCDYHMAMFTEMDGKRIAFSGDNISLPNVIPSLIYRNHVHRTSHRQTAELFRERRPQVLCSGHALFTNVDPEGYDTFYANASRLTELFETLLPKESGILGIEPSWLQIVPYQIKAEAGARVKLEVRVRNPLAAPARVEVSWVLPEGWSTHPATAALDLAADSRGSLSAELLVPKGYVFRYPKLAVSLEATLNGKRLGQVAEAVVEHVPYGPAGAR
jgi:glyoxylase-like metal-dependent hydrolase (beta-lactamase superfamily II)